MAKYRDLFNEGKLVEGLGGSLVEQFGIPPFSVLDARSGAWQSRKAAWLSLGMDGRAGRGGNLLKFSKTVDKFNRGVLSRRCERPQEDDQADAEIKTGSSVFDPVVCELFYRWYVPPQGKILDPFCGGSMAGIIANRCSYNFIGLDVRQEQIDANLSQAWLCTNSAVRTDWILGDAREIEKFCKPNSLDAVWSCPPYASLENYSGDPQDISTLHWDEFLPVYKDIIQKAFVCLKPDRFAGVIVGEVRHKKKPGFLLGFVPATISAFVEAGFTYYDEAPLVMLTSLPIRAGRTFSATRKLGRAHQMLLIFLKGCPRKAVEAIECPE